MSDAHTGIKAKHATRATNSSPSLSPLTLPASFPALPFLYLINIPCFLPIPIPTRRHPVYLPCQYTISLQRALSPHCPLPNQITILLSTTCQLSSATQRASGSSTSTGTCSPSVASGTQKEEVSIYGSAFVPVRSSALIATPPAYSMPHRPFHSWLTGQ